MVLVVFSLFLLFSLLVDLFHLSVGCSNNFASPYRLAFLIPFFKDEDIV